MRDRLCSDPSPNGITIEHHRVVPLAHRDEGRLRHRCLRRVPVGAPLLVDELHAEGEPTSRRREHQLTEQPALERWAASCPFGQRCCCRLASLRWEASRQRSVARDVPACGEIAVEAGGAIARTLLHCLCLFLWALASTVATASSPPQHPVLVSRPRWQNPQDPVIAESQETLVILCTLFDSQ